jgi:hypothetical protein
MPSAQDFQNELTAILEFGETKLLTAIIVKAGNLHRLVGGYPGSDHRMPVCCEVMRRNMIRGDEVLSEPPKGNGANLVIKYYFPRSNK